MKKQKRPNYLWSLIRHKFFIIVAGIRVGKIPFWRLLMHDFSKFYPSEFIPYLKKFQLGKCSDNEFDKAWLHHIHNNPHHWQHWLIENEPIEIPEVFIREMIVDWLATGKSYQGSWDIQNWINNNYPKMNLHLKSKEKIENILSKVGLHLPNFFDNNFGSIP